jgi:hypothetical protein
VRSQPALADLPTILLSAMPEPENEPHCWTLFFREPANLDALLSTVSTLVAERLGNGFLSLLEMPAPPLLFASRVLRHNACAEMSPRSR